MRELTHLSLSKTRIKNESLRLIGNLFSSKELKYLNVANTRVSDKGVNELKGKFDYWLCYEYFSFCSFYMLKVFFMQDLLI